MDLSGQIMADGAYSSGEALPYIEDNHINARIPNFGQYIPERPGFIYNHEKDQYECQRGHKAVLSFKGTKQGSNGYVKKTYRSSERDCKTCPFRAECCGQKTGFKKIDDSLYKPLYDKMHLKLETGYAKRMSKLRSATVEPVPGTLINYLGLKKVNTRGISGANKHCLLSALCYNLKKLIKFNPLNRKTRVNSIKMIIETENLHF